MIKENTLYMLTSCGTSDHDDRLMGHVETEVNTEIRTPADGKSKVRIIRQLSSSRFLVQCLWCGDHFKTYFSKIVIGRGKYCSKSCIGYANGAQRNIDRKGIFNTAGISGKLNPNWQGGDFRDCIICGEPFWLCPSRRQETCSNECGYERAKLTRSGLMPSLGHYREYGGISYWGALRNEILIRDNYTCQNEDCGVYLPNATGFLHIHHKVKLINGGNNRKKNLITYCRDCHTQIHKYDRIR